METTQSIQDKMLKVFHNFKSDVEQFKTEYLDGFKRIVK